jgi:glutaredoxin 3
MPKVEIYTSNTCTYCHQAKEYFQENNIEYTEHNVSTDIESRKALMKKGIMSVPLIVIDGEDIVGFDEEKIKGLLKL